MSPFTYPRRNFVAMALTAPFWNVPRLFAQKSASATEAPITRFGAVADGATLNTAAIQSAIDHLAASGGGTVVVPSGVFVSGALFFKPSVNLHLQAGAVLRCSTDMANFPAQRTRIEGHFEEHFNPALLNVKGCDGFHLSGEGTLDGAGRPIWDEFWKQRNASPDPHNFRNLGIPRARLALIEGSRNVTVEGITFKDSQFWNLHLYRCDGVLVHQVHFQVPDDYKQAPSTDGIDVDSSRNVTVDGCFFSVTDDCIAAKGSKGPQALHDPDSPPVENLHVRNCVYKRGGGVLTLGSEATLIRNVLVENCRIIGDVRLATVKLRADTPQHYENVTFRGITSEANASAIITLQPWSQYTNLQGQPPPQSVVSNLKFIDIKGRFNSFGVIRPNPGQTQIGDILFQNLDVELTQEKLAISGATDVRFEHVIVNGHSVTAP